MPRVEVTPEIVSLVVLPPLLYAAGQELSLRDLRAVWRPVAVLATGLVLASATAVAAVAQAVTPLPGTMAFVLGAVLASTDPVAVSALGRRLPLPARLQALVQAAADEPAGVVEQRLAPALGAGVLVMESGPHEAVRFRHDQIREVILDGLDPRRRCTLQLTMARRLARTPEWFAVAAEQYLPVIEEVEDAGERRQVARLLRRAAGQAALIGDYALVDALLSAALPLTDPDDTATLADVHTARHAALFCLGRLDEADQEYRAIERLRPAALDRAAATAVQITSLTHANRIAEAVGLGVESMRALGISVPAADLTAAELGRQLDYLYQWLDQTDAADDLARPELADAALVAATRLIDAVLTAV